MDLLGPSRKQATSVLEQCSTKEGESTVRKPAEWVNSYKIHTAITLNHIGR